jgi:transcription initiation factor TFIIH subunit 4
LDIFSSLKRKEKRFYPTRYAISLANGLGDEEDVIKANENGYIVVETNYRIYAYSSNNYSHYIVSIKLLVFFQNLKLNIYA